LEAGEGTLSNSGISYIVPAFNCETTISASINSILTGNFSDFDEIVIVDDASTDRTPEIILEFSKKLKNMQIIRHPRNLGGGAARNTAVKATTKGLIFCLDSDNLLLPGSVPMLAAFVRQEGVDAAAFGGHRYFNHDPKLTSLQWSYKTGEIRLSDLLCGHINPASSGNYIYSRESWLRAGGYPTFADALDAWGFGLRQIGCGARMLTMRNTYYLHRWGHESYWIRWSRKSTKERSAVALELLAPFLELLSSGSKEWLASEEKWFEALPEHPLLLKSGERGIDGVSSRTIRQRLSGLYEEVLHSGAKATLFRRLGHLAARKDAHVG
jgi:GT2 family glycosyltransferase